VLDAETSAWIEATGPAESSYVTYLRDHLAARAEFLRIRTLSDDSIDTSNEDCRRFVELARKYALPRRLESFRSGGFRMSA
jgi:hypothetical protein